MTKEAEKYGINIFITLKNSNKQLRFKKRKVKNSPKPSILFSKALQPRFKHGPPL